jgi:hypothetical protein
MTFTPHCTMCEKVAIIPALAPGYVHRGDPTAWAWLCDEHRAWQQAYFGVSADQTEESDPAEDELIAQAQAAVEKYLAWQQVLP